MHQLSEGALFWASSDEAERMRWQTSASYSLRLFKVEFGLEEVVEAGLG
jgi:hypothetical protein